MGEAKVYRMGEFAKHLGVSRDLIKHYEKHNILSPQREDGNEYRYYYHAQYPNVLITKKLQNLGYSLKEIQHLLNRTSLAELSASSLERIALLERKQRLTQILLDRLRLIQKLEEEAASGSFEGCTSITSRPSLCFFPITRSEEFLELSEEEMELLPLWEDATPAVDFCSVIQNGQLRYGFVIEEELRSELQLPGKDLIQFPATEVFCYNHHFPRRPFHHDPDTEAGDIHRLISPAVAAMRGRGLQPSEPICIRHLFEGNFEGSFCYFSQITVPFLATAPL